MKLYNISAYQPTEPVIPMSTGIDYIDSMFNGGFRTGNLIIMTASTGTGKTTISLRICLNMVLNGIKCAYISGGEQAPEELFAKMMCMHYNVLYTNYVQDSSLIDEEKRQEFIKMTQPYLFIFFTNNMFDTNNEELTDCDKIMSFCVDNDIPMIFYDYLGASIPETQESSYAYYTNIAQGLKTFCYEYNKCIFTTMQTNRSLKIAMKQVDFTPDTVDETFMADSIGPARKATHCIALINYKNNFYMNVFKNRDSGKIGCQQVYINQTSFTITTEKDKATWL